MGAWTGFQVRIYFDDTRTYSSGSVNYCGYCAGYARSGGPKLALWQSVYNDPEMVIPIQESWKPAFLQHNVRSDTLTLITITTTIALMIGRIGNHNSRALSRLQDYLLPPLILVPFVTGYLAMHPWINPFNYDWVMFFHVMSANLIFVLIPFTKLSHCVLLPTTQLVSEVGWHFPADSGEAVAHALHKEGEPI